MNAGLAKPIHAIWFIEQARLVCINRLLQRFSSVCRRGCATIRRCLACPRIVAPHNQKIQKFNARRPLVLQADVGVELQLRDVARGEQASSNGWLEG
jgi:hypothetical protein